MLERPNRDEARKRVNEILMRPFDPEEAEEYDRDLWNRKNVEAMARQQMGARIDAQTGVQVADPHEVVPYVEQV